MRSPLTRTSWIVGRSSTSGDFSVTGTLDTVGHTLVLTSGGAINTTGATLDYKRLVEHPDTS